MEKELFCDLQKTDQAADVDNTLFENVRYQERTVSLEVFKDDESA